MRISDEDINKVREATDLVALVGERVPLKPKGREVWCCCPLHHEKTPSFKIDPATQLWHCFGCGEGGDAFGFIMKLDDLTFPEAVRKLADRAHIDIQEGDFTGASKSHKQRLKDVCREAAEFFHLQLMRGKDEGSGQARAYLGKRGLGGEIPKEWMLGYAPGRGNLVSHLTSKGYTAQEMIEANVAVSDKRGRLRDRFFERIMFPINDAQGECIAFGGRIIGSGEPKYLNSQETPIFHKSQVLYALDKAKASMTATGTAVITEGYTDVIAMHKAGITNTVATLGTALTKSHLRLLARHAGKRIVYIFDGDAAGQRATERALQFIDESVTPESGSKKLEVYALCLPGGKDPAEYLAEHSGEEMQALIRTAQPLILFGIERRLSRHDRGTPEGRAAALADALSVLAPIKDSILAKDYAVQIASMLRFREEDVLEQLKRIKKPRSFEDEPIGDEGTNAQSVRQTVRLSVSERNRLALEREFLSAVAQNPVEFLSNADSMQRIKWHDSEHVAIADLILNTLMEKLDASPAEIIARVSQSNGKASSILTSASPYEDAEVSDVLSFLSEELLIGDIEEELAEARAHLSGDRSTSEDFERVVALQNELNKMRNRHRLLT